MKVDIGTKTHSSQVSTPSVKRKRSMDNSEENVRPRSRYTTCLFDENKHKSVDHGDPFAVRDLVLELDSSKYGSVTKDIADLFSRRKQMLMPCFQRFPSLSPDSVGLKSGKDSTIAPHSVVMIDSDDDEPTCQRPFQPYQDVVLNKATGEFSMKQFLGGDYAQGRASKGVKDRVTAAEPSVTKDRRIKGENKHDKHAGVEEDRNVEDDDAKGENKYDKGVPVGVAKERNIEDDAKGENKYDKGVPVGVAKERSIEDDAKGEDNYDKGVPVGVAKERSVEDDAKGVHVVVSKERRVKNDAKGEDNYDKGVHVVVAKKRRVKNDAKGENKYDKGVHVVVSKERSVKNDGKGKNNHDKGVYVGVAKDKSVEDDDAEGEDKHDKGVHVGVEDEDTDMEESDPHSDFNFDGLADIWKEMTFGLESSKDIDPSSNEHENEDGEECDHSFILKEDIGYVCRVCGIIQRSIESIIEFQRPKSSKSIRTYYYESQTSKSGNAAAPILDGVKLPGTDFSVRELSAHPRHKKQMKPHQVEGFNFLRSNLVSENPGGCILAHAPGSGKTFMLISFIQSFMAKYPDARPLVILPRGILGTWKKEFIRWQIEHIPLFDLYSLKADGRVNQFEVLKQWANQRSILFLGYKQFSSIVCDTDTSSISISCQEILLTYPSILILDEGHTPRNQDTNVFASLEKVQTLRKVVLSGTLYQNHVKEVFNILNLVRPKFLRMEDSKVIKRRILSRVPIESRRNLFKKSTDNEFYEVVEHTLLKDDNFKRKVTVIEDLREMTSRVLHYYKGDFLDELPGLVDFSVFLKLSPKQKREVSELKKLSRKFKISSDGSAIYVHPRLKSLTNNTSAKDKNDDNSSKIDELLENLDEREGVKAKFFLNMVRLCESGGEKLLVFGQYLLPLKFLMRLTMKVKGWSLNKEIFMITGDHDNDEREIAMDQFNNSPESRVFFGSIKACGEGISLVGASRIIILDVHLNPSITRQAIGRAFRPGQVRKVYTYRLIAADSPEEEDHVTCFKKESISKMWFEWNEFCGHNDFEMETVSVKYCGDQFLEASWLNEDITAIYKR